MFHCCIPLIPPQEIFIDHQWHQSIRIPFGHKISELVHLSHLMVHCYMYNAYLNDFLLTTQFVSSNMLPYCPSMLTPRVTVLWLWVPLTWTATHPDPRVQSTTPGWMTWRSTFLCRLTRSDTMFSRPVMISSPIQNFWDACIATFYCALKWAVVVWSGPLVIWEPPWEQSCSLEWLIPKHFWQMSNLPLRWVSRYESKPCPIARFPEVLRCIFYFFSC